MHTFAGSSLSEGRTRGAAVGAGHEGEGGALVGGSWRER